MNETDIWAGDFLGRSKEAKVLETFLVNRVAERRAQGQLGSYALNLNAQWGHGKTFFLRHFANQLRAEGHVVALVDAWETDFSEEPLVAIMSAIDKALKPHLKKAGMKKLWDSALSSGGAIAVSLIKNVTAKAAAKFAGDFVDEAAGIIDATDFDEAHTKAISEGLSDGAEESVSKLTDRAAGSIIKAFRTQEDSISLFRAQVAKVSKALGQSGEKLIFVFVDELDRCRPSYAIKTLEAAKHLFATDGVVFVFATNTEQLAESVKAVYGQGFDSSRYLYRFFDRTYRFEEPGKEQFIATLLTAKSIPVEKLTWPNGLELAFVWDRYAEAFGLGLRDIEQCADILSTVLSLWDRKVPIQFPYLITLISLYHGNSLEGFAQMTTPGAHSIGGVQLAADPALITYRTGGVYYESPARSSTVTISSTLSLFQQAIDTNLHEVKFHDNPFEVWLRHQLHHEFSVIHGNSVNHEKPPKSMMREYADYVRLASHFEDSSKIGIST